MNALFTADFDDEDPGLPNVVEELGLFEQAGVGLAREEAYRLFLAMAGLKKANGLASIRFFGKVGGRTSRGPWTEQIAGSEGARTTHIKPRAFSLADPRYKEGLLRGRGKVRDDAAADAGLGGGGAGLWAERVRVLRRPRRLRALRAAA